MATGTIAADAKVEAYIACPVTVSLKLTSSSTIGGAQHLSF